MWNSCGNLGEWPGRHGLKVLSGKGLRLGEMGENIHGALVLPGEAWREQKKDSAGCGKIWIRIGAPGGGDQLTGAGGGRPEVDVIDSWREARMSPVPAPEVQIFRGSSLGDLDRRRVAGTS